MLSKSVWRGQRTRVLSLKVAVSFLAGFDGVALSYLQKGNYLELVAVVFSFLLLWMYVPYMQMVGKAFDR